MTASKKTDRIPLRSFWEREDTHFTPWLAESQNIGLVGEAIGTDLAIEATESSVGSFRVDLVCRDTNSNRTVLVENQLTRTDHKHLGQLLTYAAGYDTAALVWVAETFHEDHKIAIENLNKITRDNIAVFGLEIEVLRVGDAPATPYFKVVAAPWTWTKRTKSRVRGPTPPPTIRTRAEKKYWASFNAYMEGVSTRKPLAVRKGNRRGWPFVGSQNRLSIGVTADSTYVFVQIQNTKFPTWFDQLEARREEIETALGFPMIWRGRSGESRSYIQTENFDIGLNQPANWDRAHQWSLERLDAIDRVFRPHVKVLDDSPLPGLELHDE